MSVCVRERVDEGGREREGEGGGREREAERDRDRRSVGKKEGDRREGGERENRGTLTVVCANGREKERG